MVAAWEKKFHTLPKLEDNLQINFTELTFSGMKNDDEGGQKSGQKGGQKGGQKNADKTIDTILQFIKDNPSITRKSLAKIVGISQSAIQKTY